MSILNPGYTHLDAGKPLSLAVPRTCRETTGLNPHLEWRVIICFLLNRTPASRRGEVRGNQQGYSL